ncbi:hypothetical protein CMK22_11525 [Candidatus Poribacteria bacterium]|nr:hypothetical protein [Candidatus Poribacteria bacterium]
MESKEELYDQALTLFAQNKLEEAIKVFLDITQEHPDYIEGHMGLAHSYERIQNYDGAIEAVKNAIDLNPDDSLAYSSLSMFYQRKGMITEAEEAMAQAAAKKMKS